jgi:ATP-binding protein involved in chromosome partitioning
MNITETIVKEILKTVKYPGYSRDIVSFGLVKNVWVDGADVRVEMHIAVDHTGVSQQIQAEAERALKAIDGIGAVLVQIKTGQGAVAAKPWNNQSGIPGIGSIVAVASGKGGVGKSTVAVNLACALSRLGARVGLLDCDIYGPSIPLMMGVQQKPNITQDEKLEPLVSHGVKLMSIGFLIDGDAPVIWRGPMIVKTIQQFLGSVDWGTLDCLVIDLPPGTGDAQLTLCQTVPLNGGVVVTTPQEASLGVVRKGINMFLKLNVPILGIVENMSYYTAPNGDRVEIFGHGGGRDEAGRQKVDFLGEVPIFKEIREGGDKGVPVVVGSPEGKPAEAFMQIAKSLRTKLS